MLLLFVHTGFPEAGKLKGKTTGFWSLALGAVHLRPVQHMSLHFLAPTANVVQMQVGGELCRFRGSNGSVSSS